MPQPHRPAPTGLRTQLAQLTGTGRSVSEKMEDNHARLRAENHTLQRQNTETQQEIEYLKQLLKEKQARKGFMSMVLTLEHFIKRARISG